MKSKYLAGILALGLLLPAAGFAAEPTDDQLVQIAIDAVQSGDFHTATTGLGLKAFGAPTVMTSPAASPAAILANFVTVGAALAPRNAQQPTPCFGCLTTTTSPNTLGLTLPLSFVTRATTPTVQFTFAFQDNSWNNVANLSFVLIRGSTVFNVVSIQGAFLYPSNWVYYWTTATPLTTGDTYTVVGLVNYGNHGVATSVTHFAIQ